MRNYLLLVIFLLILATACNRSKSSEQVESTAPQSYTVVDPATAATVRGTINFKGQAPAPRKLDMSYDPACQYASSGPNMSEQYEVNNGKLENVFVYVKEGLEGKNFEPPKTPVILDQKGCRYVPHVLGLMVHQPLRVLNSDPTMHNIHPFPKIEGNHEWNISQQPKGAPIEKTFSQPEIMLPVQCNNHPWMRAFLNISKSPFYAVSDGSGNFEIKGLPPGEYTIAAVHEKAGEQTQKITVGAKETRQTDFTFSTPSAQ